MSANLQLDPLHGVAILANTAVTPGSYGDSTHVAVFMADAQGRITTASSVAIAGFVPTTTQVIAGTGLSGGGALSANVTLNLANTAVAANSYGDATHVASFTVDAQGRLTAAASVAITGFVASTTQVIAGTGLSGGGALSANVTLNLANTAVTPATYGDATHVGAFTVDQQGRITAASNVAITGGGGGGIQTIANAATISIDASLGSLALCLLGTTATTTINGVAGTAGQTLITAIKQDGVGGRAFAGWASIWKLRNGTYIPSPGANAVDLITWVYNSTDSFWEETARQYNVLGITAPVGQRLWLSVVDLNSANNGGADAVNAAGPAATASKFFMTQQGIIYGCRFTWAGVTARTVRVKLWTSVGIQATVNINTTGAGVYTAYFATPYVLEPYTIFTMSIFDISGTDYTKIDQSSLTSYFPPLLNAQSGVSTPAGKALWYTSISTFAANDTSSPNSNAVSERYLIDPIYDCSVAL